MPDYKDVRNKRDDAFRRPTVVDRTKADIQGQDVRLDARRAGHLDRGSYINYYDDLGISTTADNAAEIREQDTAFRTDVAAATASIDSAQQRLDASYNQGQSSLQSGYNSVRNVDSLVRDAWGRVSRTFVPIRVVNGDTIENTYYLPRSVAESVTQQNGYSAAWVDDNRYFNVDVRGEGGRLIGQELHDNFREAREEVYNSWYNQAAPSIIQAAREARRDLDSASSSLNSQYMLAAGDIDSARSDLNAAIREDDVAWSTIRADYEHKKDSIKAIMGGLTVQKGVLKGENDG